MPCKEIKDKLKYSIITFEERNGVKTTVGVDVLEGEPEFFMMICVHDVAGCQHIKTRGGTAMVLLEKISRATYLTFDKIISESP